MDRLEHELRDVLAHERRALSSDLVSLEAVHAGATRRRRRRTAVVAAAGAVVLVAVAVPTSLVLLDNGRGRSPVVTSTKPPPQRSPQTKVTTPAPKSTTAKAPLAGLAWAGARVVSMSATSTRTILVLGVLGDSGACKPPNCLRLVQSHDAGQTFTSLPVPRDAVAGDTSNPSMHSVTNVRFGSATDGWLYGNGLWATHDGARTWHRVTMPGAVSRLAAANGVVWALVTTNGGNSQQLWRSTVGSDAWTQVPAVTVGGPGDVALLGSRVVVLGAGQSKVWVSKDGASFTSRTSPCSSAMGAELSASTSLWAKCQTGTAAYVVTSADGLRWHQVNATQAGGSAPNSLALGARGRDDAFLALGASLPLVDLYTNGSRQPVSKPPALGSSIDYLGFTSVDVGYAIDGTHLWRTADGGNTWTRLRIG